MGVQYKDYYEILGVSRNADEKEIRSAYRKLARKYHPDTNPGNHEVEEKFKAINEAYEVLKDPEKRRMFDSLGSNWRQGQNFTPPPGYEGYTHINLNDLGMGGFGGGMGGFSDFFEMFFGQQMGGQGPGGFQAGPQGYYQQPGMGGFDYGGAQQQGHARRETRPANTEQPLYLDLAEVARGGSHTVLTPSGKSLSVSIPRGVKEGAKIRLAGEGQPGPMGQRGDLLLVVHYKPHPHYKFEDGNLVYEAPVPVPDLVLGGEIKVPTFSGEVSMTVPPSTQPGRLMRLKGQGMPQKEGTTGDLMVRLKALIPAHPSNREKELYRELKSLQA